MVVAVVEADQHTLTPAVHGRGQRAADGGRPYEVGRYAVNRGSYLLDVWKWKDETHGRRIRPDGGWMDTFYVPCWAPKAPQALGWGGLLSEYIGHHQLLWSSSVSS